MSFSFTDVTHAWFVIYHTSWYYKCTDILLFKITHLTSFVWYAHAEQIWHRNQITTYNLLLQKSIWRLKFPVKNFNQFIIPRYWNYKGSQGPSRPILSSTKWGNWIPERTSVLHRDTQLVRSRIGTKAQISWLHRKRSKQWAGNQFRVDRSFPEITDPFKKFSCKV